eukprot:s7560_g2.t1
MLTSTRNFPCSLKAFQGTHVSPERPVQCLEAWPGARTARSGGRGQPGEAGRSAPSFRTQATPNQMMSVGYTDRRVAGLLRCAIQMDTQGRCLPHFRTPEAAQGLASLAAWSRNGAAAGSCSQPGEAGRSAPPPHAWLLERLHWLPAVAAGSGGPSCGRGVLRRRGKLAASGVPPWVGSAQGFTRRHAFRQQSGLALLVALLAWGLFATVSHPEPLGAAKPAPRRLAHRSKSAEELSASTAEEGGEEGENDKELFWHRALQGLVEEGAEIAAQDVLGTGPLVTSTTNASNFVAAFSKSCAFVENATKYCFDTMDFGTSTQWLLGSMLRDCLEQPKKWRQT